MKSTNPKLGALTTNIKRNNISTYEREVIGLTDVNDVFITSEAAREVGLNASYMIKLAKKIGLNNKEMREAGNRNYLFSREALEKIKAAKTVK